MALTLVITLVPCSAISDEASECAAGLAIVASSAALNSSTLRYRSILGCESTLEELQRRVDLALVEAASAEVGKLEAAPFFDRSWGSDAAAGGGSRKCFRAVVDDFVSEEEADMLEALLEPLFVKSRKQESGAADVIVPSVLPDLSPVDLVLVDSISARVTRLLSDQFDVDHKLLGSAYVVARSSLRDEFAEAHADQLSRERHLAFSRGELTLSMLPTDQCRPHIDAAWLPAVAYTVLLYLGRVESGGETLFLDSLTEGGLVGGGTLISHRRRRAAIYSAGPENVHCGAGNYRGNRTVLQFWVQTK